MPKITYWCNYMGPINKDWLERNGNYWAAGRIDISGTDEMFGESIGLPPMHIHDWNMFSYWLKTVETDDVWTLDQLVNIYELGHMPIRWFAKETTEDI